MRWQLCLILFVLAGCAEPAPPEVVVTSTIPGEEVEPASEDRQDQKGTIAGFVLSDSFEPVKNASVAIPGLDIAVQSDADGAFGFTSLWAGPYRIVINATGFLGADAVVDVASGETVRIKVVLTAIPPPEAWHETLKFDGFAEVTDAGVTIGLGFTCTVCDFDFQLPAADTLILEVITANTSASTTRSFYVALDGPDGRVASGNYLDPVRVQIDGVEGGQYRLRVDPASFPLPEVGMRFEVFVSHFHNGPAPEGWSIRDQQT